MEKEIQEKTVLVTGAARGIGLSIAEKFLQGGAKNIIILDVNEEVGLEATDALNKRFGADKVTFYKCDVTTDLDSTFDTVINKFKNIDVLVNNAGVVDEYSIRKSIAVNTVATVEWTMKFWEFARRDKRGKGGTVINISSLYGFAVDPFLPVYKTTKHAVVAFTRTIGHKFNYEQTGVRVIVLCPGLTTTDMAENIKINKNQQYQKEAVGKLFIKMKWLTVVDVSNAIAEMFKKADSGTAWSIIGEEPLKEIPVSPESLAHLG